MRYCIANIFIIGIEEIVIDNYVWEKFQVKRKEKNKELIITYINAPKNRNVGNLLECYKISGMQYFLKFEEAILFSDSDWRNNYIIGKNMENIELLIAKVFYAHALKNHILQCHSALIETNGSGLMFLGPSGIGKTTQAELWNRYRNALIINGDIVFVQETPDAFLGWGTPWHGSSPYCENTSVPLKAMIVLKQSPENSIRELTGFEKVTAVSNNVFYPRWLENGMELCLETLDHLLSGIPVYELSCRPDEEAVKLTEETIFGSGSVPD